MTPDLSSTSKETLVEVEVPILPFLRSLLENKEFCPQKLYPAPLRGLPGQGSLGTVGSCGLLEGH